MKLFVSLTSPYGRKVRIVLAEKRIECELELVDVTPADTPLNAHNPLGKVPTLLLDDDTAIYDSRVIVEFLDNVSPIGRLIPEGNRERVGVRRWEALADAQARVGHDRDRERADEEGDQDHDGCANRRHALPCRCRTASRSGPSRPWRRCESPFSMPVRRRKP